MSAERPVGSCSDTAPAMRPERLDSHEPAATPAAPRPSRPSTTRRPTGAPAAGLGVIVLSSLLSGSSLHSGAVHPSIRLAAPAGSLSGGGHVPYQPRRSTGSSSTTSSPPTPPSPPA